MRHLLKLFASVLVLTLSSFSLATTVQVQTNLGNFEINLFDTDTPETVANFLTYVEAGDYSDVIFHRSVPGFIVQAGGFTFVDGAIGAANQNSVVVNEPVFSNVRGTIAMAKLGSSPNSATNQWFVNLADNSGNLDNQNGGFTVFGQVMGEGMSVVDAIAAVPTARFEEPFNDLPLQDYDISDTDLPTEENYIKISAVVVLDATIDTANDISPVLSSAQSGGGSSSMLFALALLALAVVRRQRFY